MSSKRSAKSSAKPRIAFLGAGNLAVALAVSLRRAGYRIEQIITRDDPGSLRRARRLAQKVGASAAALSLAQIKAEIVWFCVPDGAIADAAQLLTRAATVAADWKGKVALHSSGASTSDELDVLRKRGAAVASVHPLMTFVRGSRPPLKGVPFAVEGDARAIRAARAIIADLGGQPFSIGKQQKAVYHAWGMFTSPLLTALLAASETVALQAGIDRKAARQRMQAILRQTLANYARLGAAESFSGPIARGDVRTVQKHLNVLSAIPLARQIYIALARSALHELPVKKVAALRKILS